MKNPKILGPHETLKARIVETLAPELADLEVDGKQHYSDGDTASPRKYAEMVALDRDLRLQGYEVYRFGGYELNDQSGAQVAASFFSGLLRKHGVE